MHLCVFPVLSCAHRWVWMHVHRPCSLPLKHLGHFCGRVCRGRSCSGNRPVWKQLPTRFPRGLEQHELVEFLLSSPARSERRALSPCWRARESIHLQHGRQQIVDEAWWWRLSWDCVLRPHRHTDRYQSLGLLLPVCVCVIYTRLMFDNSHSGCLFTHLK